MLTASIVTYHTPKDDLERLIHCVLSSSINKLFLVDNSRNDALRCMQDLSPRIRYIHSENVGYGRAHNIAIREAIEAGSRYHVVINPDIYFGEGVIEELTNYMETYPDIGLVMPRVENPGGGVRYICKLLPTPFDLLIRRFLPASIFSHQQERFTLKFSGYDTEMNVPYLSGCFMFIRTEALKKVGLFDERFFMYGEDTDLSRRIHAQYRTMYYPNVMIHHGACRASYKSFRMLLVHIINLIRYFNKWGWIFDAERRTVNKQTIQAIEASKK